MKNNKNLRFPKYLLFGLVGLQVALLIAQMVYLKGRGESGGGGSSSFPLPIWIAIFIPIIAARRKKQSQADEKRVLWILVGLALLVLIGMVVFFLKVLN